MKNADYIITPDLPVIKAIERINCNSQGLVYVCEDGRLAGVVTDGDIRRYILKGGDLQKCVWEMANKSPKYVMSEERENADRMMEKYRIRSLPVLNRQREIVELCFQQKPKEAQKEQLGMPVAIMAGGKGARLYPYTQILPKPLIPIGEKTITEHIMDRFSEYGCTHFDMIINYKKNFIKSYFLDNEISRDVVFIEEQKFMGTGGGLKLLKGRYTSTFFMSNCDILIEADYGEIVRFHREKRNLATMVCAMKHVTIPYGTVEVSAEGTAKRFTEKPELSFITNTGLYVLEPAFLEEIPEDTFIHITDIIQKCIAQGKPIGVYPVAEEQWLDMGQMDELERMKKRLCQ